MAKDKDRSLNPTAVQRKADKAKAVKKARNEKQTQRNEKLARRNPDRIQRQIDDLKALETAGDIKPREQAILAELERDLKAVRKARDALGDTSQSNGAKDRPQHDFGRRDGDRAQNANHTVLGKRRHNGERARYDEPSSGEETDESVRNIPMPRDTPPPIPRARMPYNNHRDASNNPSASSNADQTNPPDNSQPHGLPKRPPPIVPAQTTYSSAPQLRDLKKEAVSRFVPTAVKQKQNAIYGKGALLEPEELDRLEQAGYLKAATASTSTEVAAPPAQNTNHIKRSEDTDDEEAQRLADEEARFEQELALETVDTNIDPGEASKPETDPAVSPITAPTRAPSQTTSASTTTAPKSTPVSKIPAQPLLAGYYSDDDDDVSPPSTNAAAEINGQRKGLFSSLPPPRRVEMEEVDDEDL